MQNDPISSPLLDPARLASLRSQAILDTAPETGFDDVVRLATRLCAAPVALVSLVSSDRQWFKANIGFLHRETDLDRSVCKYVLAEPDLLVIPDLTRDGRTATNPLVTDEPHIRFYAGAPLRTMDGHVLGSLCVIDVVPRPDGLLPDQADDLRALGRQVSSLLELRRAAASERSAQAAAIADAARLETMIAAQQNVTSGIADLDAMFRVVTDGALAIIGTATGAVVELREGDELVYRTTAGSSAAHQGRRLPLRSTLSGRALLEQAPFHCPDIERDPDADHALARSLGIRSMIVVPVFRQGVAVGVLKVQSGRPDAFGPRDVLMAQVLGGLVASGFGEVAERQTQQALRDAESRYKAIFDSAIDFAIVAADAESRITDWNTGAERILGWQAQDVHGELLDTFFTPEDQAAHVPRLEEQVALAVGSAADERWHLRKDGERFWATGRMMTLRHEDDGVRGYLKILQDRTGEWRRQTRLDLVSRCSEALLSAEDPTAALLPLLMEGAEALGFDQSYTWDLASDGESLLLGRTLGVDEAARAALRCVSLDAPLCGIVAETGSPLILSHLQADATPRYALAREAGVDAYAGYPITAGGVLVGAISFASRTRPAFDSDVLAFFATLARFLCLARERLVAKEALRAGEEYWRGLFERLSEAFQVSEAVRDATGRVVDWRYVDVNEAWGKLLGTAGQQVVGRLMREVLPYLEPEWIADFATVLDTGRPLTFSRSIAALGRHYEGRAFKLAGQRIGVLFLETTERVRAATQRASTQQLSDRLRDRDTREAIVAAAAEVVGTTLGVDRAGYCTVDADQEIVLVEQDWHRPELTSIAGRHSFRSYGSYVEALKQGREVVIDDALQDEATAADSPALEQVQGRALVNLPVMDRGRVVGVLFALSAAPRHWRADELDFMRDVADRTWAAVARVEAEQRQHLLNHELSHRLKNTLAIVLSIASQTLRAVTEREPVQAFERRVMALSRAHDVLLEKAWEAASIEAIAGTVLMPHAALDRFDLRGPEIRLAPAAALSLSLLLHELATNAAKYGALSVQAGRVELAWEVTGTEPILEMRWREYGGPPAIQPTRRGFGSRLIGTGLVGTRDATVHYGPEGFVAVFRAPLARVALS